MTCECGNPSAPDANYGGTHGLACTSCKELTARYHHRADPPRSRKSQEERRAETTVDEAHPPMHPILDTNTLPYGMARWIKRRFNNPSPSSRI